VSSPWKKYRGLVKEGVQLTEGEKRRQALQFAALGAGVTPVFSGLTNLISHGKVSPWAPLKRWIPAQVAAGALAGGALPAIQHMLAQSNIEKAKSRISGQKALEVAKPAEIAMATKPDPLKDRLKKLGSFMGAAERLQGFAMSPESAALLAGTGVGLGAGRALSGHTAAGIAPRGRKMRSEDIARRAAFIGAPLGTVALLALAKKKGLTPRLMQHIANKFPRGMVTDPATEQSLLKFLIPAGTAAAGGVGGGLLTGGTVGAIQQMRGSPYKKDQEKKASMSGQDLRLPVMGGVKPPTQDSKAFADKQLSMSSAEVGPVQPSTKGAKIEDIVPKYKSAASTKAAPYQQTRKGKRPIRVHNLVKKAGDLMDPVSSDPLVLYLQKQAQKDGQLEANISDMPKGKEEKEQASECPCPPKELESKVRGLMHAETKSHFDNTEGVRKKHTEKDHTYDPGVVDRVLGL